METLKNIKKHMLVAVCILSIVSCDTSEADTEVVEIDSLEGFESNTGNSDTILNDDQSKVVKPFLHMSFDSDVSEEEASALFNEAVEKHFNNGDNHSKISRKNWVYRITTRTGNSKYDGTDGTVKSTVRFFTNTGNHTWTVYLNNPGNDREKGKTDYYGIPITFDQSLRWVELRSASISLKGEDKWVFNKFKVDMTKQMQPGAGSENNYLGGSLLNPVVNPAGKLDNNSANGWDTWDSRYDAANNGYGSGRISIKQPSPSPDGVFDNGN